jgi:hypothetical protein
MVGVFCARIGDWLGDRGRQPRLVGPMFAAVIWAPLLLPRLETAFTSPERRSAELYGYYEQPPFAPPFVSAVQVGAFLREQSNPDDLVLIVGSEPEILFYADRRSATRYTIFYPPTGHSPRAPAMIDELIAECESKKPRWVVLATQMTGKEENVERVLGWANQFLQARYVEEHRFWADRVGRAVATKADVMDVPGLWCSFRVFRLKTT